MGKLITDFNVCSENIYNIHGKGFLRPEAVRVKVLYLEGKRDPANGLDGNRAMVTVIKTIADDGRVLPPISFYNGFV